MAFKRHTIDHGLSESWEYFPGGAIVPEVGKALVLTAGQFAVATGTTEPTHICMRHEDAAITAGTILPAVKADPAIVWETTFSAAATLIKLGDKVTLSTDGTQVTATTTGGVATVVWMEGTAEGDKVRVRFEGADPVVSGGSQS